MLKITLSSTPCANEVASARAIHLGHQFGFADGFASILPLVFQANCLVDDSKCSLSKDLRAIDQTTVRIVVPDLGMTYRRADFGTPCMYLCIILTHLTMIRKADPGLCERMYLP